MASFASIQKILVAYLPTAASGIVGVSTKTNSLAASGMPFVRVQRIGGSDDYLTDTARVDVEVFCTAETDASDYSELIRQAVHAMTGRVFSGRLIDGVETAVAPAWVDYANPKVQRYVATYLFTSRIA